MVERVAKAIFDAMDITDGLDASSAERYARAAIEAMRITEDAPAGNAFDNAFALVKSDWNAAIDAALRTSI